MARKIPIMLAAWVAVLPVFAAAGQVYVAAAANLSFALKDIIGQFEKETGHRVRLSLGSSGSIYSQIVNGAPFDLFLAADVLYPKKVEEAGMGEPGGFYVYAEGRIVLWVPNDSRIDLAVKGMQALEEPSVRRISIANPVHAPYGQAAVAAMEHYGIYNRVREKIVSGESILQAAQFVQSGAADIGIIALSLALAPPMSGSGRYWMIPADSYPKIEQGALILKRASKSGNLGVAKALLDWVRGARGRAVLERYGFGLPKEEKH